MKEARAESSLRQLAQRHGLLCKVPNTLTRWFGCRCLTLNPLFCCLLSSGSTVDSESAWISTAIKGLANSSHVFLLEFKCLYLYNTLTFENIFIWFANEVGIAINFMVEMRKPKFGESVISQGNLAAKLYVRLGLNTQLPIGSESRVLLHLSACHIVLQSLGRRVARPCKENGYGKSDWHVLQCHSCHCTSCRALLSRRLVTLLLWWQLSSIPT